jgi:hypothetical protein
MFFEKELLEKTIDGVGEYECQKWELARRRGSTRVSRHSGVRDYRSQFVGNVVDTAQILPNALALLQRRQIRCRTDKVELRRRRFRRSWLARILGNSKIQKRMSNAVNVHFQQVLKKNKWKEKNKNQFFLFLCTFITVFLFIIHICYLFFKRKTVFYFPPKTLEPKE